MRAQYAGSLEEAREGVPSQVVLELLRLALLRLETQVIIRPPCARPKDTATRHNDRK